MKKRLHIDGMMCAHCTSRVEKALNAIEGIFAKVDLKGADVELQKDIADAEMCRIVEEAGYNVTQISENV